eukprot:Clim_evm19s196 gene=Clim_evmTU19s196
MPRKRKIQAVGGTYSATSDPSKKQRQRRSQLDTQIIEDEDGEVQIVTPAQTPRKDVPTGKSNAREASEFVTSVSTNFRRREVGKYVRALRDWNGDAKKLGGMEGSLPISVAVDDPPDRELMQKINDHAFKIMNDTEQDAVGGLLCGHSLVAVALLTRGHMRDLLKPISRTMGAPVAGDEPVGDDSDDEELALEPVEITDSEGDDDKMADKENREELSSPANETEAEKSSRMSEDNASDHSTQDDDPGSSSAAEI